MWLPLIITVVTLFLTVAFCAKKKATPSVITKKEPSSISKAVAVVPEAKKPEGSAASDIELKPQETINTTGRTAVRTQSSSKRNGNEAKASVSVPEKTPTIAEAEATQLSSHLSSKKVHKPSNLTRKKASKASKEQPTNLTRTKPSKEKTIKTKENSKMQNEQQKSEPSSADDSDTFKHVMSIRDVVKKDKEMKQKKLQKST